MSLWLRLLDCDDQVHAAIEANKISASAAVCLHSFRREEQREMLVELLDGSHRPTKERVAAYVRARNADAEEPPYIFDGDELLDGAAPAAEASTRPRSPRPKPSEALVAPKRRQLKKVLALVEAGEVELDAMVVKTIKVLTGVAHPRLVKGLSAALAKAEG